MLFEGHLSLITQLAFLDMAEPAQSFPSETNLALSTQIPELQDQLNRTALGNAHLRHDVLRSALQKLPFNQYKLRLQGQQPGRPSII